MSWLRYRWNELAAVLVPTVLAFQASPWWWTVVGLVTLAIGRQEWRVRRWCVRTEPEQVSEMEIGKEQRA